MVERAGLRALARKMGSLWNQSHIGPVGIVTIPRGSFADEARRTGVDAAAYVGCIRFSWSMASETLDSHLAQALVAASALQEQCQGDGFVVERRTERIVPLPR